MWGSCTVIKYNNNNNIITLEIAASQALYVTLNTYPWGSISITNNTAKAIVEAHLNSNTTTTTSAKYIQGVTTELPQYGDSGCGRYVIFFTMEVNLWIYLSYSNSFILLLNLSSNFTTNGLLCITLRVHGIYVLSLLMHSKWRAMVIIRDLPMIIGIGHAPCLKLYRILYGRKQFVRK